MRKNWIGLISTASLLACAGMARAQDAATEPPPPHLLLVQGPGPGEGPGPEPFGDRIELLGFEGMHPGKIVKGAPFSATATSESSQTLQDGTTIHRTTKIALFRDGEGRSRHEVTFSGFGPLQAAGKVHTMIMINDPVAGSHFVLNPDEKVAHKMPARGGKNGEGPDKMFHGKGPGRLHSEDASNVNTESLGTQNINGVNAEGTRVTRTIAAGQIGNDQPIRVVFERWYSPELQVMVKSTRSDPRFGSTTYNLTNIQRAEPSAALFTVPSDYTLKEGRAGQRNHMRGFHGAPPAGGSSEPPSAPPSDLDM